jgi:aspartyl-tRNA(Asn)/glutamyl-tRNA(Gln) amidotransferase subunit A
MDGCAISLPCHAPGAPPSGLMLAGAGMQDDRLFGIAAGVEGVLGFVVL